MTGENLLRVTASQKEDSLSGEVEPAVDTLLSLHVFKISVNLSLGFFSKHILTKNKYFGDFETVGGCAYFLEFELEHLPM